MEYEEFKVMLKGIDLSVKEFAELSKLSYRTCSSWSRENRKVPNWVSPFIELYIENQECKKYKESIQTLMSGLNSDK
ncbi:MAG TPA: XRE family transcriptional regulator [Arcobacter sp.]|nr:XRE family transcriptional regulator [Arcobacter sp.]